MKLAKKKLQQEGWLCGYSEASNDAATSILDLLADAHDALPEEGLGKKFKARLSEFNITAGPLGFGVKLESDAAAHDTLYSQLLKLLSSLGKIAVEANVGVALLIDEAQALPQKDLGLIMRVINRLDDLPVGIIICGLPAIPGGLIDKDFDYRTPVNVWYHKLPNLDEIESGIALRLPASDAGCEFEHSAVDLLIAFSTGNPQVLQMLGSAAWTEATRRTPKKSDIYISRQDAEQAIEAVRHQLTISSYGPIWNNSSEDEKTVLRYLAAGVFGKLSQGEPQLTWAGVFVPGLNTDTFTVLCELSGKGVIRDLDSLLGNENRRQNVQFVLPGFAEYLAYRLGILS